jgi:endonuclease/exonuclease/phosphatase family metal-dependent hydrolase
VRSTQSLRLFRPIPLVAIIGLALSLQGCTGAHTLARRDLSAVAGVSWFAPAAVHDQSLLSGWAAAVGPPVIRRGTASVAAADTLRVISWNTAIGAGNLLRLIREERKENDPAPFVLLLQEVYRGGPEVPEAGPALRFAGRLGAGLDGRTEIEAVAEATGLHLYYVPSMRNGAPRDSDEDRGNAILSSLPLEDLTAIELPFERQRRVAVAATVTVPRPDGTTVRVRLVSVHLDNMVGAGRGWILGGEFGRLRQARALVELLRGDEIVVFGGDFNTWFGGSEAAYREIRKAFPGGTARDTRPTFLGLLRLDHLFFRIPAGWSAGFQRAAERYGSDHYPLFATVRLGTTVKPAS